MNQILNLRKKLGISQAALGIALGCSQKNISLYEHGQSLPSEAAKKLIKFARSVGCLITYEDVYGPVDRSEPVSQSVPAEA